MCNCIDQIKAAEVAKVLTKHNPSGSVSANWDSSVKVRVKNKQQRVRVIERPSVSLTIEYKKTTTNGQPFKRPDVMVVQIKPIYCCLCGGRL